MPYARACENLARLKSLRTRHVSAVKMERPTPTPIKVGTSDFRSGPSGSEVEKCHLIGSRGFSKALKVGSGSLISSLTDAQLLGCSGMEYLPNLGAADQTRFRKVEVV